MAFWGSIWRGFGSSSAGCREGSQHAELHFTVPCLILPHPCNKHTRTQQKCSKTSLQAPAGAASRTATGSGADFHGIPSLLLQKPLPEGPLQHSRLPPALCEEPAPGCALRMLQQLIPPKGIRAGDKRGVPRTLQEAEIFFTRPFHDPIPKDFVSVLVEKPEWSSIMSVCISRGVTGILPGFLILFSFLIPPPNFIPKQIHYVNLKVFLHPLLEEQAG